jgi:hypothetical protein
VTAGLTVARRRLVVAALALFGPLVGSASAQEIAYNGGIQFATGRYLFDTRTASLYVLSGIDLAAGPVRLGASIPVVLQSTPWIAYGPVPLPSGGRQAGEVSRQTGRGQRRIALPIVERDTHGGFGDPLLRADVELVRDGGARPSIRLGVGAKPPLASVDSGFSTGAWDYGTGLSVSKRAGLHLLSAEVSYWRFGDMEDLVLDDAWSYGAAYGRGLASGRWSLLFAVSGFTSIIDGQDPPVQIGVGIGRIFSPRRALTGNVSFGLTNTAPDVSVGIGWRFVL